MVITCMKVQAVKETDSHPHEAASPLKSTISIAPVSPSFFFDQLDRLRPSHLFRHRRLLEDTGPPLISTASSPLIRTMGLWTLLEGFLLLANAFAILNENRFLAPRGWSFSEVSTGRTKSFKGQLIGLIYATQYMRLPLILLNAICIFVKLVSG